MKDSVNVVNLTDMGFGSEQVKEFSMFQMAGFHARAQFSAVTKIEIAAEKLKEELAGKPLGIAALDGTILY